VPENLFITLFFILILYMEYMYGLVHLPPPMLVSSFNKKWPLDLYLMLRIMLIQSHYLKMASLIEFFCLQLIQRFLQGFLPVSFNETWVTNLFHSKKTFKLNFEMMPSFTYHLLVPP
jgi:hypothetical protein